MQIDVAQRPPCMIELAHYFQLSYPFSTHRVIRRNHSQKKSNLPVSIRFNRKRDFHDWEDFERRCVICRTSCDDRLGGEQRRHRPWIAATCCRFFHASLLASTPVGHSRSRAARGEKAAAGCSNPKCPKNGVTQNESTSQFLFLAVRFSDGRRDRATVTISCRISGNY